MAEKMIALGDAQICTEAFGRADDPVILLMAGAASSMDWWEDAFVQRLADGTGDGRGRYVIRYDNRDTGRSTSYPPGKPGYTGMELVTDALGVLDAYGVQTAHLVGLSMGGGIAQDIALRCPDRVESLTLICTSPAVPGDPGSPALPPPAEHIQALFAAPPPDPDWSDREAVIQWFLNTEKAFAGSIPADDNRIRAIAGQAYDRTTNMAASQNHWRLGGEVLDADPAPRSLAEITAPALILHGTEDPLFPYPHGEALAARIPDARLVPLEGGGHQMPAPEVWDTVITEILRHTSSDRRLRG